eukprot:TRINITY_DN42888_c0_g1_i1.p1 TRINITY_DN42888_c0_g1~~TRINITY_DN42888_c0_g1_i1.p1  ORF type:complete len:266 (-),score=27.49 TRINITY_DN42888_c0_g1_i1:56-853(-)
MELQLTARRALMPAVAMHACRFAGETDDEGNCCLTGVPFFSVGVQAKCSHRKTHSSQSAKRRPCQWTRWLLLPIAACFVFSGVELDADTANVSVAPPASDIKHHLHRERELRHAADVREPLVMDDRYEDSSCSMAWALDKRGRFFIRNAGFATEAAVKRMVDSFSLQADMIRSNPILYGNITFSGISDVRQVFGCSPLSFGSLLTFMRRYYATHFSYVAVVGSGFPMRLCKLLVKAAGVKNVDFFSSPEDAQRWLGTSLQNMHQT